MMCAHERFVSAFRNDYFHVADEENRGRDAKMENYEHCRMRTNPKTARRT